MREKLFVFVTGVPVQDLIDCRRGLVLVQIEEPSLGGRSEELAS